MKKLFNLSWLKSQKDPEIRALARFLESQNPHRWSGYHKFREILEEVEGGYFYLPILKDAQLKWFFKNSGHAKRPQIRYKREKRLSCDKGKLKTIFRPGASKCEIRLYQNRSLDNRLGAILSNT